MAISTVLLFAAWLLLVVLYIYHRWQHHHILNAAAKLPCPPAFPILGNALFFTDDTTTITKRITDLAIEYKQLFCVWMGPLPVFVVSRTEDAKVVLNTSNALEKDITYKYLKPYLGNGIITGPVSLWKKYRRLINPVFHPTNLETFIPAFNEVSRELLTTLEYNELSQPINPKSAICSSVVNAAVRTVFGGKIQLDEQLKENIQFLFNCVGTSYVTRLLNPILHFDWIYKIIYPYQVNKSKRCLYEISKEIKQSIWQNRLKNIESSSHQGVLPTDVTTPSMLNIILNGTVESCAENHWIEESITVLAGATDTVVSSLSLLLITLAMHPEIQAKVYSEIQDIIGCSKDDLGLRDLNRMQYMTQVILESMRLHSVIPMILRKVTGPVKIGDAVLPAGSRVMIALHAMGWDPEVFPEPHKFNPERFSPDMDQSVRPSDMFMPYSAGPRNCIGKTYSMLLMKSILVHILRQYTIATEVKLEDIEYDLKIVMYTKNPLLITFKKR